MTETDITVDEILRVAKEFHGKFPPSEVLVEVLMNSGTLGAMTRIIPATHGQRALSSVPVRIVDELPAGEYRLVFADGGQRVVIDGMEVVTIPPTKGGE